MVLLSLLVSLLLLVSGLFDLVAVAAAYSIVVAVLVLVLVLGLGLVLVLRSRSYFCLCPCSCGSALSCFPSSSLACSLPWCCHGEEVGSHRQVPAEGQEATPDVS